jgi:hypothetical protein
MEKISYEVIEIIFNALLTYNDGNMEYFKAVYKVKDGIITGKIIDKNVFLDIGFIPNYNIKNIVGKKIKANYRKK